MAVLFPTRAVIDLALTWRPLAALAGFRVVAAAGPDVVVPASAPIHALSLEVVSADGIGNAGGTVMGEVAPLSVPAGTTQKIPARIKRKKSLLSEREKNTHFEGCDAATFESPQISLNSCLLRRISKTLLL